ERAPGRPASAISVFQKSSLMKTTKFSRIANTTYDLCQSAQNIYEKFAFYDYHRTLVRQTSYNEQKGYAYYRGRTGDTAGAVGQKARYSERGARGAGRGTRCRIYHYPEANAGDV